jgi:hypothetical protein
MSRTKKRTNFLAILLSLVMAFSLLPAFALAAEDHDYYEIATELKDGEEYVITVNSGEKYYALKGAEKNVTTEFGDAIELDFDGNYVVDPDALAVWKYSESKKQLSTSNGDLYFASSGVKYQTSQDRPVTYDNNLFATVNRDGRTLDKGDIVYLKFNENATDRKFTTTVSKGGTSLPEDAAKIVIYSKLSAEDKAEYEKQKEEEATELRQAKAEALKKSKVSLM